jgi:hypothetical protein
MNIRKGRGSLLAFVAVGAVILLFTAVGAGAAGRYTEPTGDSTSAPDIKGASVTSNAAGQLVFSIDIVNLPSPANVQTFLFIDSDAKASTGDTDLRGAEYFFAVDESDNSYGFGHWNGSSWDDVPGATVTVTAGAGGVRISVNQSELAGTAEFNFWVGTRNGADNARDKAPDFGAWNYSVAAGGPHIVGILTQTKPTAGPRSGKSFSIEPIALRLPPDGTGVSILPRPESYRCRATLAGKRVAGNGKGKCAWKLPKNARGKRLIVNLSVSYGGASSTARYAYKVK